MRLLCWSMAVIISVGAPAVAPVGLRAQGILTSEITGKLGGASVGEAILPQSGGPDILLPASSVLLGASILIYALLRQQRRA